MLITNFSSGELSETLFGRTDLPQYYSGAARIENFDVIPTGGIKRRGGTERLLPLDKGNGRIIPFIAHRGLGFLLYLTPLEITVYKIENGEIPTGEEPGVFTSGYTPDEIGDVQFAQCFDTMILAHENHPPLEVKHADGGLEISELEISFEKTVVTGTGTEGDSPVYKKDDEAYKDGWLAREGHYPAAVSFYNGRLVFASTKNNRQRIFASAVKKAGENYNFATNKVFLTEKKEYITVYGSIDTGISELNEILMEHGESAKFTKPVENYFLETFYYPPGTKAIKLQGNKLVVSEQPFPELAVITAQIQNDINFLKQRAEALDNFESSEIEVASRTASGGGFILVYTGHFCITPGASKIKVRVYPTTNTSFSEEYINENTENYTIVRDLPGNGKAVREYESNPQFYRDFIMQSVNALDTTHPFYGWEIDQDALNRVVNELTANSLATMKYRFASGNADETYYDYGPEIKKIIEKRYYSLQNIYIPLYTRDIIADEYPVPDCGFTFEIASDANDAIRWLAVNKGLIAGTETGEWIIPPDVHAANIRATLNSRCGSDKIQGTAAGDATVFFHAGKKSLVEYYIPQQDNNFRAGNMAVLAMQMLSESPAKDFDFISSPHTKLLVTREDGSTVTLLYERGTGTFAWGRILTAGEIKCAAVLPGPDGNDDAYLVVRRGDGFYLERLGENCRVYLDSYKQWDGNIDGYTDEAVICDEEENEVYPLAEELPEASGRRFIGYPYTSRVKSMPILANNRMKPNNIKNLLVRFLDSYMPQLKTHPNGAVDTVECVHGEPYSGVYRVMFPGEWDQDVMFEFIHDAPNRCSILAINAEVN